MRLIGTLALAGFLGGCASVHPRGDSTFAASPDSTQHFSGVAFAGLAMIGAGIMGVIATSSSIDDAHDAERAWERFEDEIGEDFDVDANTDTLELQRAAWIGIAVGGGVLMAYPR